MVQTNRQCGEELLAITHQLQSAIEMDNGQGGQRLEQLLHRQYELASSICQPLGNGQQSARSATSVNPIGDAVTQRLLRDVVALNEPLIRQVQTRLAVILAELKRCERERRALREYWRGDGGPGQSLNQQA